MSATPSATTSITLCSPLDVTHTMYDQLKQEYPNALQGARLITGSPSVENVVVFEADYSKVQSPASDQYVMCRVHAPHVLCMLPFTIVHYRFVVLKDPAPSVGVALTRADGIGDHKPTAVLCQPGGWISQLHMDNNATTKGVLFYHTSPPPPADDNIYAPFKKGDFIDCILEIHSSKVDIYVVVNDMPLGRVFQMAVEDSVPSLAPMVAFDHKSQGSAVAVIQHRLLPPPADAGVPYRYPLRN